MKFLKTLSFLFIGLISIIGCERDEICIEETTPYLIIRFYDYDDTQFYKKVVDIKVELEGIEGFYEDDGATIKPFTDSIAIPVKVTEDITSFKLILNANDQDDTNDNEDVFDLNYIREDVFVSRSCGYKTLYYDVTTSLINDNDNWIRSIETVKDPQDILNQNSNNVNIFY